MVTVPFNNKIKVKPGMLNSFLTFEVRLQIFEFYSKFENGHGGVVL